MKSIFFNLILAASAALFPLPSHLSAQPAPGLDANNDSAAHAKAERPRGPVYGHFSTSATSFVPANGAISFNDGVRTKGIRLYVDYKTGEQGVLVEYSGAYSITFSASNMQPIERQTSGSSVGNATIQLKVDGILSHGSTVDVSSDGTSGYNTVSYSNILIGTQTIIDICVPCHDCRCPHGILLQVISPTGLNLCTNGGLTATLSIIKLGEPSDCCDE